MPSIIVATSPGSSRIMAKMRMATASSVPSNRLGLDEGRDGVLLGLGSTYRALGQYPEAVEVLGQGVSEFPADRSMQTFLALALYNVGEHRQAVDLLLKHLVETTSDPGIRSYEKALRFYTGRLDQVWG